MNFLRKKKPLTLVLGGTGKTGRRIVDRLNAAGHNVRVGSRSAIPSFDWDHAIAAISERLRSDPGSVGLVLANGGWLSKEAVGIWSTEKPDRFEPVEAMAKRSPDVLIAIEDAPDSGTLETFTVTHAPLLFLIRLAEPERIRGD